LQKAKGNRRRSCAGLLLHYIDAA